MERGEVLDLLEVWAAWANDDDDRLGFKPETGSAERLWLPPAGQVFAMEPTIRPPVVCDDVGMRIERAVLATGRATSGFLRDVFIRNSAPASAARRHGLHGDPREVLDHAVRLLGDVLDERRAGDQQLAA